MENNPITTGDAGTSGSSGSEPSHKSKRMREPSLVSEYRRNQLLSELRKKIRRDNTRNEDSSSEEEPKQPRKTKTMRGNKLAGKETRTIEIGWMHEGQQVRKQTGGGTRKISVAKTAVSHDIIEHAINLFFPEGLSKRGIKLEDVDVHLCDFSMNDTSQTQSVGETYEKEKPSGILRWYLSTRIKVPATKASLLTEEHKSVQNTDKEAVASKLEIPVKSSASAKELQCILTENEKATLSPQTSIFVQTSKTSARADEPRSVQTAERATSPHTVISSKSGLYPVIKGDVCMSQDPLNISYSKDVHSLYSDNVSQCTASSRSQCIYKDDHENDGPQDIDGVYDPLQNGYRVSDISKKDMVFVTLNDASCDGQESLYTFPSIAGAESSDPYLILHHPNEVWGFEEGKLILAIVTHHHNNNGVSYEWFCDGEPVYCSGCVMQVNTPGLYHCRVRAVIQVEGEEPKEFSRDSHHIQIVRVSESDRTHFTLSDTLRNKSDSNPEDLLPDKAMQVPQANVNQNTQDSFCQPINSSDVTCDFTEPINSGSYGEVFKGTLKGAAVAIKKIRMKKGKRPDRLILKEAAIHQRIAHQNIVKFMGTYMDQCHVFIVTEYVEGNNMDEIIYSGADPVDREAKISVAIGVLEGVNYLHSRNPQIIHQDIKPANILIDTNLSPKICDLGLARTKSYSVASTSSGLHAVGTLEYMPPEVLLHCGRSSAYSDMWSLGLTLMEWLTYRDPWNLQEQEEEPGIYIRDSMQRKDLPAVFRSHSIALLVPCMDYVPANRPTAFQLLKRFQCPSCTHDLLG